MTADVYRLDARAAAHELLEHGLEMHQEIRRAEAGVGVHLPDPARRRRFVDRFDPLALGRRGAAPDPQQNGTAGAFREIEDVLAAGHRAQGLGELGQRLVERLVGRDEGHLLLRLEQVPGRLR